MVLFQRKKQYSKISYEKRITLINLVEDQKLTIRTAAKRLHIKLPTAKVILHNYRKKGKILQKKVAPRVIETINLTAKQESKKESISEGQREEPKQAPIPSFFWVYYPSVEVPMFYCTL